MRRMVARGRPGPGYGSMTPGLGRHRLLLPRWSTVRSSGSARGEMPVICASCGADNDAGRKFCLECGTSLAAACPACGTPNPPAARFCGECGARVAGAAAPAHPATTPAPAIAERRLVSVLFADLVG